MARHTISHASDLYSGDAQYNAANSSKRGIPMSQLLKVSLGTPIVADPDGICASQAVAGAADLTIDGALASGGAVTLDVPRTLVVDADGAATAVLTITGTDAYGEALVENITLNGTTAVVGLKAFKTITTVASSAATTGNVFVGTEDTLGLPYRVDAGGLVMAWTDSTLDLTSSAVLGTFVPAVTTDPATAITGDVRGTYNPVGTLDGSAEIQVLIQVASVATKNGAYGVDQYGG